jgi:hypothetical protein
MDLERVKIKTTISFENVTGEPLTQRRSISSQKTGVLDYAVVETTELKVRLRSQLERRWDRHVLWCEPLIATYSVGL